MKTDRPNILLLHWHDLGRFLACYGRKGVSTPHLDRLAAEGVLFENAWCTSPLCSPARASLFTGQYPHTNGLLGLTFKKENWRYRAGVRTLPMYLREAGYRAFLFGQQHEGRTELLGFEECYMPTPLCLMDPVTTVFSDFLKHRAGGVQPFFASVGFFEPHRHSSGYPAEIYGDGEAGDVPDFLHDEPCVRRDLYGFYEAIRRADENVGKILATLEASGLSENTFVIFTTDHGSAFPRAKSTLYNPGLEISLIMRWPGRLPAGRRVVTDFSGVDLLPTLLDSQGLDVPACVEGASHWLELSGEGEALRRPVFAEKNFHQGYDPIRAVMDGGFKYIRNYQACQGFGIASDISGSLSAEAYRDELREPRAEEELYDLARDPLERRNLAGDPAFVDRKAQLKRKLEAWMAESGDYLPARADHPPLGDEWSQLP